MIYRDLEWCEHCDAHTYQEHIDTGRGAGDLRRCPQCGWERLGDGPQRPPARTSVPDDGGHETGKVVAWLLLAVIAVVLAVLRWLWHNR